MDKKCSTHNREENVIQSEDSFNPLIATLYVWVTLKFSNREIYRHVARKE